MKKFSLLTVALIAVLAICVGTASAQTASIGYQGMVGTGTNVLSGLSVRGWVDAIGWEGTLFFGRADIEADSPGGTDQIFNGDVWALDAQAMYAIIQKENSKLYLGLHAAYGQWSVEGFGDKEDDSFWMAGPVVGAQYTLQGIPELSFNWEVAYDFLNATIPAGSSEIDIALDGMNTTIGVHYAF
ncbi:MAG: hypothetical protein KKF30_15770 [Proteobacteria bacterium]|nr:hypothetical protein [Pseudomonadota bacterium]MBU4472118.1 hypothetical protein [Pseudomonadota bacterium]MCG2752883.1 hypothetical protein [Desulfobacteraceae bacterium]